MNVVLAYCALGSITAAIVFTGLFLKHVFHVGGLSVMAMALVCGISGHYEAAFRWFCLGTIATGLAGCLERFLKGKEK